MKNYLKMNELKESRDENFELSLLEGCPERI